MSISNTVQNAVKKRKFVVIINKPLIRNGVDGKLLPATSMTLLEFIKNLLQHPINNILIMLRKPRCI